MVGGQRSICCAKFVCCTLQNAQRWYIAAIQVHKMQAMLSSPKKKKIYSDGISIYAWMQRRFQYNLYHRIIAWNVAIGAYEYELTYDIFISFTAHDFSAIYRTIVRDASHFRSIELEMWELHSKINKWHINVWISFEHKSTFIIMIIICSCSVSALFFPFYGAVGVAQRCVPETKNKKRVKKYHNLIQTCSNGKLSSKRDVEVFNRKISTPKSIDLATATTCAPTAISVYRIIIFLRFRK